MDRSNLYVVSSTPSLPPRPKVRAIGGAPAHQRNQPQDVEELAPVVNPEMAGAKASLESAGYVPTGNSCGGCAHFNRQDGSRNKVEGTFRATDACANYYEPYSNESHEAGESVEYEAMEHTPGSEEYEASEMME